MSALGMNQSLLASGLEAALAKDAAAGSIGFVAREFGPNLRGWLRQVADATAPAQAQAMRESAAHNTAAEKLAEGIANAARKAGICDERVVLDDPALLMLLDDMARACRQQATVAAASQDLEQALQGAYERAIQAPIPPMPDAHLAQWWFGMGYRMAAAAVLQQEVRSDARTPADHALEHAEYLAKAAEQLIEALRDDDEAWCALDDLIDEPSQQEKAAFRRAMEARAEHVSGLAQRIDEFRKRHARAEAAAAAVRAALPPWRPATEHDVSRLEFMTVRTPAGEKKVKWVTAEHEVQFADGSAYPLAQVEVRGEQVVRLDELSWNALQAAAARSKWMPPEYMVNDWLADACRWLEDGPRMEVEQLVEEVAKEWDGCVYAIDAGQAIRTMAQRILDGDNQQGVTRSSSQPARERA